MVPIDPEFWKNIYGDEWESASKAVIALHEKIIRKFPELADSAKFGLGATTGKKIKIPPTQKHEADITYYYNYKVLCHIQVSAPQKGRVPPGDIWVLKGKYEQAVAKDTDGEKTWFYLDYPMTKHSYVLDLPIIEPFAASANQKYLKKDSSGKWIPETYIDVPCQKGLSLNDLLDWIGKEIARRKKP
jgi:hypothetical protein